MKNWFSRKNPVISQHLPNPHVLTIKITQSNRDKIQIVKLLAGDRIDLRDDTGEIKIQLQMPKVNCLEIWIKTDQSVA